MFFRQQLELFREIHSAAMVFLIHYIAGWWSPGEFRGREDVKKLVFRL
jgi:hypothetical protein